MDLNCEENGIMYYENGKLAKGKEDFCIFPVDLGNYRENEKYKKTDNGYER